MVWLSNVLIVPSQWWDATLQDISASNILQLNPVFATFARKASKLNGVSRSMNERPMGFCNLKKSNMWYPKKCFLPSDPSGKIQCGFCMKFIHPCSFKRHVKNQHGDVSSGQVLCDVCNKFYKNEATMKEHKRIAHKIYQRTNVWNSIDR